MELSLGLPLTRISSMGERPRVNGGGGPSSFPLLPVVCDYCGARVDEPCRTYTGAIASSSHYNRSHASPATIGKVRPATQATVARAKRQAILWTIICVLVLAAWVTFYSLSSTVNGIDNLSCDPSKRLSCSFVETPDINRVGDVMSFLLGIPALVAAIVPWVLFREWRDEVWKLASR